MIVSVIETFNTDGVIPYSISIKKLRNCQGKIIEMKHNEKMKNVEVSVLFLNELFVITKKYTMFFKSKDNRKRKIT